MSVGQRSREHFWAGGWRARVRAVAATVPETRPDPTMPRMDPVAVAPTEILGFPAETATGANEIAVEEDDAGVEKVTLHRAAHTGRVVVVRRAERIGGLLLVLAGLAAGLSLWFPWVRGDEFNGLSLVSGALAVLAAGGPEVDSASWQPVAVVLGGGALLVLGVLLFLPAASHRFIGLLAFLVAETAAMGMVVPLAASGWSIGRFDLGMWFAVAVPVLGVLGALKAMLTTPRLLQET
jgi:hypothetical protein